MQHGSNILAAARSPGHLLSCESRAITGTIAYLVAEVGNGADNLSSGHNEAWSDEYAVV
jgi:hypothetical protein